MQIDPVIWPLTALQPLWRAIEQMSGEIRLVGGCVRDALLHKPVKDLDAATTLLPATVMAACQAAGIHTIPTGLKHGTVTALLANQQTVEITTLRADLETDGRHAVVSFTSDWAGDAARRDFTMNALYADLSGQVYDLVGGLPDLQNGIIRTVGKSAQRFQEDYLRILRLYRFYAWYGQTPLGQAERQAAQALRAGLKQLSRERVNAEIQRLLKAPNLLPALQAMQADGIWKTLFGQSLNESSMAHWLNREPELLILSKRSATRDPNNTVSHLDPHALREDDPKCMLIRWAVCWPNAVQAAEAAQQWGWRKKDNGWLRQLAALQNQLQTSAFHLTTALHYDGSQLVATALLAYAPDLYRQHRPTIETWQPQPFPLTAKQLMAHGMVAGPQLGEKLRQLEAAWLQSDRQLTAAALLDLV